MTAARTPVRSPLRSTALHVLLVGASVAAVFPVAWVVLTSVKTDRDTWARPGSLGALGLENYRQVLVDTQFGRWFANSLIVAGGTTLLAVLIAATAGYAASRMRFPGHRPLMWMFLVVQMFPAAVLIVPLYNVLADLGLLNTYGGLILAQCTVAVPYCAWMLKGYFDTIPVSIDEAGRIDGLSPFGTFWRLIVPLSRPGIAVTVFYSFITAWGEVAFASVFMQSEDRYPLPVGMATFVSDWTSEWGLLTASSVLVMVPAAVVFFLVQRHLVAGLTAGGVKG
ncbi:arabinogalactan oligomer / maltooligosaccharide transport system permease protein [Amycolatopsis arida]|uniref:Arabinogalactan oligomer / maltooligosaccharide transport system permease protein n=1 Tax=Amycolatopsis arida TaxID=587909 RepID=A0A1I5THX5_9PSEU|nr:carbohydrate ABC transporter permease [Amycolatopsis arida]TDX96092.1 arabinogalactan oligomer/maltooligosaccharide transport system permease protein [Amycolatopsis arida]SFP82461.1 arabinogalactan oligomer / maltooligosaccharide transport system permease protein [Amycolatopsis arida]